MNKRIIVSAALILAGMLSGAFLMRVYDAYGLRGTGEKAAAQADKDLPQPLAEAYAAAAAIRDGDFDRLASMAHPTKGVYFTPYSQVDTARNLNFSSEQLRAFGSDKTAYVWGVKDGDGSIISLTPAEYFARYVYDRDFFGAPEIGINRIRKVGNSLENVFEVFPGCPFVEFHFPGEDPKAEGMDWDSLKLVFESYGGKLMLVAVIHSEWTI